MNWMLVGSSNWILRWIELIKPISFGPPIWNTSWNRQAPLTKTKIKCCCNQRGNFIKEFSVKLLVWLVRHHYNTLQRRNQMTVDKVIFIEITKVQLENKTFVENLSGFHKRTAESGRESFCRFGALSILVS